MEQDDSKPQAEWKQGGGKSDLATRLKDLTVLLEGVKVEMQKDLARKVKTLDTLMRSSVANDPKYRVRRKPDGHNR